MGHRQAARRLSDRPLGWPLGAPWTAFGMALGMAPGMTLGRKNFLTTRYPYDNMILVEYKTFETTE
ncbi:hypothetical protein C7256_26855 [Enterocloster lavalensis]|nr:hypothetical protein C7256_26855 [Enterocloster lavalensis]